MKIRSAGYLSDEILMEEIEAYRADCRKYGYRACLFDHINEPFEEMDLNCRVTHRTDISLQILNFLGRTGGEKKLKEVVSREDAPSVLEIVKEEMEKATGKRRKEVEKLMKCMNKEEEMSTYESNIWRMYNATRILVNYDKTMENESKWKPTDVSFKRLINSSEDGFTIDFYSEKSKIDNVVRIVKMEEKVMINNRYEDMIWLNLEFSSDKADKEIGRVPICYYIVPSMYPKKLSPEQILSCGKCKGCPVVGYKFKDEKENTETLNVCVANRLVHRLGSKCAHQTKVDRDIQSLIYCSLYAIDKFLRRKEMYKNSDQYWSKVNKEVKVRVGLSDNKDTEMKVRYKYVTLRDSVSLERKTGYKHKSHKSPVEHRRRGTIRHLKSGKVVPVKESIVNKGNKGTNAKTIYKVNK